MSKNFVLEIESIIARLQPIRLEMLQAEKHFREELDHVNLGNLESARNLTHYVSLRRRDIRELQEDLVPLALSSLGRLESHTLATLDALLALLYKLAGKESHGRAIEAKDRQDLNRGLPSRAEVTDAAMSGRAECVMLNKGPHILLALDFLSDVLARMEGHHSKKSSLMRKLSVAEMAWK